MKIRHLLWNFFNYFYFSSIGRDALNVRYFDRRDYLINVVPQSLMYIGDWKLKTYQYRANSHQKFTKKLWYSIVWWVEGSVKKGFKMQLLNFYIIFVRLLRRIQYPITLSNAFSVKVTNRMKNKFGSYTTWYLKTWPFFS